MSMMLDYVPTDVSPTIKDACGAVRLVDRKADVDFLCPDVRFRSKAPSHQFGSPAAAFGQ